MALLDISRRDDLGGQQIVIPLYLFGSLLDHVKVDGNWLGVAVLANGMTITCALRLDPAPA